MVAKSYVLKFLKIWRNLQDAKQNALVKQLSHFNPKIVLSLFRFILQHHFKVKLDLYIAPNQEGLIIIKCHSEIFDNYYFFTTSS